MYIIKRCAVSQDGYLDDSSEERLIISNKKDFDQVDELRSQMDAILIGANTVRKDNPRLLLESEFRKRQRLDSGQRGHPIKITLTKSGDLSPDSNFFTAGQADKIVYCTANIYEGLKERLKNLAEVIAVGQEEINLKALLEDLEARGVKKLLVEGGAGTVTEFLKQGLINELQVAIAPFFVSDNKAPRFLVDGQIPFNEDNRLRLINEERVGNMTVLTYKKTAVD